MGEELLVVVKVIGVHVLYYEERFKRWVRWTQGSGYDYKATDK
jgi:hypothetical protein